MPSVGTTYKHLPLFRKHVVPPGLSGRIDHGWEGANTLLPSTSSSPGSARQRHGWSAHVPWHPLRFRGTVSCLKPNFWSQSLRTQWVKPSCHYRLCPPQTDLLKHPDEAEGVMASEMFNSLELKCETSWVLVPSFLATMNKTSLKRNYMVKKRITQVISVQRSFKKKEIVSCNEKARTKFTGLMIYPRL